VKDRAGSITVATCAHTVGLDRDVSQPFHPGSKAAPSGRGPSVHVLALSSCRGRSKDPEGRLPRILLIDDDASLLDALSIAFEDAGHQVLTAPDGARGLERVAADRPDAVVSDVNMPLLDGLSLCRKLRESGNGVPLVLLTSRDNEIDEALGLELGADDYVAKPFSTRVLLARISALLRRETRRKSSEAERPMAQGSLELFSERLEVRYASRAIVVTVTEFRLLEALASRAGMVLSRERLLQIVRGDDSVVAERIVDTYVRRLRRKLEAVDASFDRIETVIGAGYRWKDS
jgi:DNA-binding response OmpR family regulator